MHESWREVLGVELEQPYMAELRSFLVSEVGAGRRFYPPADRVFNALALTPLDAVRAVIRRPGAAPVLVLSIEHLLEGVYRSARPAAGGEA